MKIEIEQILDTKNGDLTIIAGKPATGKSDTILEIAIKNILNDTTVLLFNLELSKESCIDRILKQHKDLEIEQLTNLIIDDTPDISIDLIISKCKDMNQERKIGMVLIDYLQLIKEYGEKDLCYELKKLALKLEVPIIISSQIKDNIENLKKTIFKFSDNIVLIEA